jgi:hypothetical protein
MFGILPPPTTGSGSQLGVKNARMNSLLMFL